MNIGTNFYLGTKKKKFVDKYFTEYATYSTGTYPLNTDYGFSDIMGYPHYEIHLAKTSCGWKTLYQAHKTAYESVEELLDLLNKNEKSIFIYDEYGQKYTIEKFYHRVILFDREEWGSEVKLHSNGQPLIDHVQYRNEHLHEYRYCSDIRDWHDKDNFDFTEGDFS